MPAHVVEVDLSEVSKSLAVLGGFIVIYGLLSYVVKERLYLSEPLLAVTAGIIVGPYVLNWVDPISWGNTEETNYVTYTFTRIVVGIQVLFCGISLPKAYLWREKLSLTILLFGIMTTAWFATALLIWGLIPNLTFLESLCIAAAVTPTDPVLANSITTGRYAEKHVPANVRNIIVAESGANDGLGFPFLYLAIYLLARTGEDQGSSIGTEVGRWVYAVVIYQILLSIAFGSLIGYLARKSLKWAESRSYIDKANFFAYGLGLAFFTLGTTGLFGSDDILACFIAGNSFTWDDWFRIRTEDNDFQEIIDTVLNMTVFVYIGAIIPWTDYSNPELQLTGWRVVVLALTVLLLRRPPWVIAATRAIPALRDFKESAFAGWFGPIGVGAVFYIQVALRQLPDDGTRDRLRAIYSPVVLFMVFASVLTHGITIPISKLGPGVMRRTATLTKTRSITFSRPVPRNNTIQVNNNNNNNNNNDNNNADQQPSSSSSDNSDSGRAAASSRGSSHGHVGYDESGKPLWNPLIAVGDWTIHVFAFWRKDSFWRKEAAPNGENSAFAHHRVSKSEISGPSKPVRQRSVEEDAIARVINENGGCKEGVDMAEIGADGEQMKSRLPPPSLQLPTSESGGMLSPILQQPSSLGSATTRQPIKMEEKHDKKPEMPDLKRITTPRRFAILRAFDNELHSERQEALTEAERGWQRGELREQKRLLDMLQRSGAEVKEKHATQSQTDHSPTGQDDRGTQEASADDEGAKEGDADTGSTHSSHHRTLRFI
ncbi:related to Na+/H+-exchanging protein [Melanopsichium pennsylvanicum]|uniref:Related to Na+/H+-exchanging protein n=2 Tax=Melanopsichium pennsylvanicum TaxID=63383 RepID=A0AAJ4XI32_9BASI|nr:related to Na /H-exchanging protein [Melanopsichium pennsylvanicum 4]SNX82925.1 related to Na+/H+-exchanging protein [Melanopsichium pennsylvanicum]